MSCTPPASAKQWPQLAAPLRPVSWEGTVSPSFHPSSKALCGFRRDRRPAAHGRRNERSIGGYAVSMEPMVAAARAGHFSLVGFILALLVGGLVIRGLGRPLLPDPASPTSSAR